MPRCLVMSEREVSPADRASYLHALAVRREGAAAASAHFWVFEDARVAGKFLEFVEAGSEEALRRGIEAVGGHDAPDAVHNVWNEVSVASDLGS